MLCSFPRDMFSIGNCEKSERIVARPKFLIMADWYLPGYKSGGPVRTIASVVERFGDQFDLRVITRDRDCGDTEPYQDVRSDCWTRVGKAQVWYASRVSLATIRTLVRDVDPQVIYLNSFFSILSRRILLLRMCRLMPVAKIVMAPRGELSPAALKIKWLRKRLYLLLCNSTSLLSGILWQASSELERQQIGEVSGVMAEIHVASDLKVEHIPEFTVPGRHKCVGHACFVFLSRISRIKNLEQVLRLLAGISGTVELDIYGPLEDRKYWRGCERAIGKMPTSVRVRYCGSVPHDQSAVTISQYHFFVLPTLGENFGHAILEALIAGCPVLISDRTPWTGLVEKKAGWDLPVDALEQWHSVLQRCVDMGQSDYDELSAGAQRVARAFLSGAGRSEETNALFDKALRCESHAGAIG